MTNNQSIKDRLLLFIDSQNMGNSQFENACGLSHGWVNGIKKTIMPDKLEKISLRFPNLNTSWLMTGEHGMYREDATATSISELHEPQFEYLSKKLQSGDDSVVPMLLEQLRQKDEQIDRLLKIIEKYK